MSLFAPTMKPTSVESVFSESDDSDSMSSTGSVLDSCSIHSIRPAQGAPVVEEGIFLDDGSMQYMVQNKVYKIHDHFLVRESPILRKELACARSDKKHLLVLRDVLGRDVTSFEFECLISFFYDGMHKDYCPTVKEWVALLSISTTCQMEKLRTRAIAELEACAVEPIEMLVMSKRFQVESWVKPAYADLAIRDSWLSQEEAKRISRRSIVDLGEVRERWRRARAQAVVPQSAFGFVASSSSAPRSGAHDSPAGEREQVLAIVDVVLKSSRPPTAAPASSTSPARSCGPLLGPRPATPMTKDWSPSPVDQPAVPLGGDEQVEFGEAEAEEQGEDTSTNIDRYKTPQKKALKKKKRK